MSVEPARVIDLPADRCAEAVEIYAAAFDRDPYMLHVLGPDDRRRAAGIRAMYRFMLIDALPHRDWLLKGVMVEDGPGRVALAGIALAFTPEPDGDWPEAITAAWARFRDFIGPGASELLDHMNDATALRRPAQPHVYLSDLAVHPRYQGQGHGGRLLDAVSALSEAHPASTGVALDTENARNVTLYQHKGYQVVDHYFVDGLETWSLFRPNARHGA